MIIQAYVYLGMWVAECECKHALALEPLSGTIVEGVKWWPKRLDVFACDNCGKVSSIQMPAERGEIERLLKLRPVQNRNWYTRETIADLRIENAVHAKELT